MNELKTKIIFLNKKNMKKKRKKTIAVDKIRTCAGRSQWISSPSP